jgi:stearoyl-CoA desaturase (delta-9 desaturase)
MSRNLEQNGKQPGGSQWTALVQWFDTDFQSSDVPLNEARQVDLVRCIPFLILHVGCLGVFFVGWSWVALLAAGLLYVGRMFAVTAFYHRYFSHRTFRTSRVVQFLFAAWGATAVQRGALWWAHHHRHHHRHSDEEDDAHSPHRQGFWWSHLGWFTCSRNFRTDYAKIPDFARFPELVFLNRFDSLVPALFAGGLFLLGAALEHWAPTLGTSGLQMLIWGFFISTMVLFHVTASINSLAHVMGKKRFETGDESRNSLVLALATLGEGWHNNHHHYMHSVRQGFYWWEIDITFYLLKIFEKFGLIWDLRPVPERVYDEVASHGAASSLVPPTNGGAG